jgi:UDP-N-acetylmuramate--alanine ligase
LKLAVKEPLTVVFKPHTFSRTASLWDDFCSALSLADKVIVTDIYPAREAPIDGINARRLAEAIGSSAEYSPDSEVYARLDDQSHRGAVVLMGAGDMEDIKYEVLNK